ncbi:MAG: branched chain amino acid aminotransferase, partial [Desulfocapsa sp.]
MLKNELEVSLQKATSLKEKPDQEKLGFGQYFTDHMFVMKWNRERGWHDAVIKPYGDFTFDPAALVFHYGQAIFEGLKAYRGHDGSILMFRPLDNLKRLNTSAIRMCMPRIPAEKVLQAMKGLVYLDREWIPDREGAALYIRPTMVATEPHLGIRPSENYLFYIIKSPVGAYYAEGFSPTRIYVEDTYVRTCP